MWKTKKKSESKILSLLPSSIDQSLSVRPVCPSSVLGLLSNLGSPLSIFIFPPCHSSLTSPLTTPLNPPSPSLSSQLSHRAPPWLHRPACPPTAAAPLASSPSLQPTWCLRPSSRRAPLPPSCDPRIPPRPPAPALILTACKVSKQVFNKICKQDFNKSVFFLVYFVFWFFFFLFLTGTIALHQTLTLLSLIILITIFTPTSFSNFPFLLLTPFWTPPNYFLTVDQSFVDSSKYSSANALQGLAFSWSTSMPLSFSFSPFFILSHTVQPSSPRPTLPSGFFLFCFVSVFICHCWLVRETPCHTICVPFPVFTSCFLSVLCSGWWWGWWEGM